MSIMYITPAPEVAAAMEASAARQTQIMTSILGFMIVCCILLGVFFLLHFCKPLVKTSTGRSIELPSRDEEIKKDWWIDADDNDVE